MLKKFERRYIDIVKTNKRGRQICKYVAPSKLLLFFVRFLGRTFYSVVV